MPLPKLFYRTATIKATPVYTCIVCGCTAYGSAATLTIEDGEGGNHLQLAEAIAGKAMRVSNQHMPNGWAGYSLSEHKCSTCQAQSTAAV